MLKIARATRAVLFFLVLAACATQRPVLYPNEHYRRVGPDRAQLDVDDCMRRADGHVESQGAGAEAAEKAAAGAGAGAAIGGAAGAAGGAVVGRAGRGAAAGAAGGGAAGLIRGLLSGLFRSRQPSPAYQNFVRRCLGEKGYDAIGWK